MANIIWSSAKQMHLLTLSQLSNYQINCKRIQLKATLLKHNKFSDFILELLEPFQETLKLKNISITISDRTVDTDTNEFIEVKKSLCLDYRLYEQIFYHLIQNAIKFSANNTNITVEVNVFPNSENGIQKMMSAKL